MRNEDQQMPTLLKSRPTSWALACIMLYTLMPALSFAQESATMSQEKREEVRRSATQLKIATFRGDLKKMEEAYNALNARLPQEANAPELGALCNYFCHYQLANYHLFKATNYPFLLSKSSTESAEAVAASSPDAVKKEADQGITYIERGLRLLYRQQTLEKDDKARAFREFMRQAALLSALKVRLYMVTGDAWYQCISKAQLGYLDRLISPDSSENPASCKASEYGYASSYYEHASWTLVEIQGDIPSDGPEFASIREDITTLYREVEARLASVRKGYLFLNIDPEAISSIPVNELQGYLVHLYEKVQESEAKLVTFVSDYTNKLQQQQISQLDQARLIDSKSMDLSLHKVAALEAQAQAMAVDYGEKIGKLRSEIDTGETRRMLREIEFDLQKKQIEYETQRQLIVNRTDQDLLAMSQASQEDRRQELRWLIDHHLAVLNLDLQLDAFKLQLQEYDRQIDNNRSETNQIASRLEQKKAAIEAEQANIQMAKAEIERLKQLKSTVFSARLAVFRMASEGLSSRLHGLDTLKTKRQQVCDWRDKVADKTSEHHKKIVACIKGGSCDGELAQDAAIKELATKQEEAISQQKENIQTLIDLLKQQQAKIREAKEAYSKEHTVSDAVLIPLETAAGAAHALPKVTTAVGLASFVATEMPDLASVADVALAAARRIRDSVLDRTNFNTNMGNLLQEVAQKLQDNLNRLTELTTQEGIQKASRKQALAELMGRKLEAELQQETIQLNKDTVKNECEAEDAQLDNEKRALEDERTRIAAEEKLETAQNHLVDQDIKKQQAAIGGAHANIARIEAERQEQEQERAKLAKDTKNIEGLKESVEHSKGRVTTAQTEVEALAQKSTQLTGVITDLQNERRRKAVSIQDAELDGLKKALKQDKEAASEKIKDLTDQLKKQITLGSLQAQLDNEQKLIAETIAKERKNIMEQAEKSLTFEKDAQKTTVKLVFASEENLANIIAGIPDFIETKRRALESANYAINLLRGRVRAIQAASVEPERNVGAPKSFYLRSGADFVHAMTDLCNGAISNCVHGQGLFFDEREVNLVGSVISIPSSSTLARTLAAKGRASFRIVPRKLEAQDMQANGYLEIGLPDIDFSTGFNASLMEIRLGANCRTDTTPQLGVRHLGIGIWFRQLGELAVPELTARDSLFKSVNIEDTSSGIDTWKKEVKYPVGNHTVQVRSFDERLKNVIDPDYLGLPLFGSYELVKQPTRCAEADLLLGLIYSTTVTR
jgi:hypothetical protein